MKIKDNILAAMEDKVKELICEEYDVSLGSMSQNQILDITDELGEALAQMLYEKMKEKRGY